MKCKHTLGRHRATRATILREESACGLRICRVGGSLRRREAIKLAGRWAIFAPLNSRVSLESFSHLRERTTHTALERATINIIAIQLADRHCCVLVCVHLNECEASIRLEASLNHVTKILEEWDKV